MTIPALDTPAVDPGLLERLHARLEAGATGDAAPDVHYRTVDSPLGPLLVAATERGVLRVAFAREGQDAVLDALAERVGPRVLRTPGRLDPVARWLDRYFAGSTDPFAQPLDLRLARGFRLAVLERLRGVPYGTTVSYGTLAAAVEHPKAVRAVGTACATNPLPLLIPCHRVVRSDGTIGAYLGGTAAKERLLALESARGAIRQDPGA
ncbi:methylated-DNA--[protein]-cysteine S-methyltransferase [Amnibacterium sp. CER49]|uniref:methylated-DNA--[protein]-cysteine S-methyltransferase n=1 Tax=Amnibacterium sp. CER49 TaxID=3039161 RepID=UPI002448C71C|nr:methylated-DNA--[protein]-cysteine S-methyltransferase [Amnibacterium sp. CER49]MDH2445266.1 methylated-DNA--[protein]-cysteine S-methyltransferase [Amnibacterium sp. CER49]